MDQTLQTVLDNIYARRSIRQYADTPIPRETIDLLLKAAMAAPSACNLQPWEFIVVDTPEGMEALRAHVPGGNYGEHTPPMAIVVCARTAVVPWGGNGWLVDCGAAIENMMLAARAMGIGSLWIGDYDGPALKGLLHIPEGVEIVNVIHFGYPLAEKRAVTRYKEEAVYWGQYDPTRPHAPRTTEGMIAEAEADA